MTNLINNIKSFGKIYNKNLNNLTIDSLIITNNEEVDLINSWISQNKKIKYELLYRATRDGDKVEDFHKKCDNISPILVLGKTPKNYIFGGYTTLLLNYNKDEYLSDIEAFIFSLNHKKKFYSKDKDRAISKTKVYCIIFGNGSNSLQITNNILTNRNHWSNPNGSYGDNLNLTENQSFSITEFEVFQIKYE